MFAVQVQSPVAISRISTTRSSPARDAFDEDRSRTWVDRGEVQAGDRGCIVMAIDLTP